MTTQLFMPRAGGKQRLLVGRARACIVSSVVVAYPIRMLPMAVQYV